MPGNPLLDPNRPLKNPERRESAAGGSLRPSTRGESACLLSYSLHQIYAPGGSGKLFALLHKQGALPPLVIAVNLLFGCIGLFSTFVLVLPGNDTFFVGIAHPHHGNVADFFLWHFLDMVPLFDFNETLNWKAPLTYERAAVGWILVLFKLVVALPVIWLIAQYYADREKEAPAAVG